MKLIASSISTDLTNKEYKKNYRYTIDVDAGKADGIVPENILWEILLML